LIACFRDFYTIKPFWRGAGAGAAVRVRRCGCGVRVRCGCDVAQSVARRLAVRQAQVRILARHPKGGPLPTGSNEEIKSGAGRVVYIKCYMYARLM
jgi:hypothetical protein